jgi:murein DD-endopeptidase MepM/ murein hydrolase activator NlpD
MPSSSPEDPTISELLREIRSLSVFGDNATFRRIYSLVASHLDGRRDPGATIACRDPLDPIPPERPGRGEIYNALSFDRILFEAQQDSMRRSAFLDPIEAATASLIEFRLGRISVLELRDPNGVDLDLVEDRAKQYLVENCPTVSVNLAAANSLEEVVFTLRKIADSLESGLRATAMAHGASIVGDPVTIAAAECTFQRTEQIRSRYINGGRALEYCFRDVYSCRRKDSCCANSIYTEYRNERWETVWHDGDTKSPPPTPADQIPDFVESPWDNRLPLLADSTLGTLTSDYGWRRLKRDDGSYKADFHGGIDVSTAKDTQVRANVRGIVVDVNRTGSSTDGPAYRGIVVRDLNNNTHTYWHINPAAGLHEGDSVRIGDMLGATYDWGARTHLHYAIHSPPGGDPKQRNDGNSTDPLP